MPKKTKVKLYVTAVLMLLTGFLHSLSLFIKAEPSNEAERQLLDLMSVRMDTGTGFHPSFQNLMTALSSCFSILYLFGGVVLFYFVRRNLDARIFRGFLNICLVFFGTCFVIMTFLTFLPPILCTGLVFFGLILSRLGFKE